MKLIKLCILFFALAFFWSCSTEKNKVLNREFHNLHAKYNGFFNANEIIKVTYNDFLKTRKENYNLILPIFPLPDLEQSKNWYAPMDTAYRKCELVIFSHRMPHAKKGKNRNREWCKYIDDNWMTMGKTRFYKKDLPNALKIFQHIENHYEIEDNYYESIFWQSKVLIEMGAFDEAEEILLSLIIKFEEQQLEAKDQEKLSTKQKIRLALIYNERIDYLESKEPVISPNIIHKIYPTLADLYIQNKSYKKAIENLEIAVENKHKKAFKTRLFFVLAQLYHLENNFKASLYYQEVVERNPEYEMAFQAKINRALSFSGRDSKAIKSQLLKMLKDDKNIEYFDQIYYALAEISFKNNLEELGKEQLQKSINLSTNNVPQKIKSMKRMGDLFFEKSQYIKSYLYYDSIQKTALKAYKNKDQVDKKYKLLKNIFTNKTLIEKNDSLFAICALDPKERTDKIYEVLDLELAKRAKKLEAPLLASANKALSIPSSNSPINQSFFIWDQKMLERGKVEFDKKWGKRILEDNWRRGSKTAMFLEENEETSLSFSNSELFDELSQNLPCDNQNQLKSMKDSNMISLFNLGIIHHYETKNLLLSEKYFKRIIENYQPETQSIASIYELYNIYKDLGRPRESREMKELLLSKYPKSKYSKLLSGDENLNDSQKAMKKEQKLYSQVFSLYQAGNYSKVLETCSYKTKDSTNPLICQYGLLKAYSLKKLNDTANNSRELINTLKFISNQCLGTDIADQAIAVLNDLKIKTAQNLMKKENWKFNFSPDTIHYFILIAPKGGFSMNKAKNNVADFNSVNFSDLKLKVSNTFLNTSDQMIIVKRFDNSKKALDYFLAFKVNNGAIKSYRKEKFFVVTPQNLKELYLEKNTDNYLKFFKDFYQ